MLLLFFTFFSHFFEKPIKLLKLKLWFYMSKSCYLQLFFWHPRCFTVKYRKKKKRNRCTFTRKTRHFTVFSGAPAAVNYCFLQIIDIEHRSLRSTVLQSFNPNSTFSWNPEDLFKLVRRCFMWFGPQHCIWI